MEKKFHDIVFKFLEKKYDVKYQPNSNFISPGNGLPSDWHLIDKKGNRIKPIKPGSSFRYFGSVVGCDKIVEYVSYFFGDDSIEIVIDWYDKQLKENLVEARKALRVSRFQTIIRDGKVITVYKDSQRKVPTNTLKKIFDKYSGARWVFDKWFEENEDKTIQKFLDLDNSEIVGTLDGLKIHNKSTNIKLHFRQFEEKIKHINKGLKILSKWYDEESKPVVTKLMDLDKYTVVPSKDGVGLTIVNTETNSEYLPEEFERRFRMLHNYEKIFGDWYKPEANKISSSIILSQLENIIVEDHIDGWKIRNVNNDEVETFDSFYRKIQSHFGNLNDVYDTINKWYDEGVIEAAGNLMGSIN